MNETKKKNSTKIVPIILGTLLIISISVSGYIYFQLRSFNDDISNTQIQRDTLASDLDAVNLDISVRQKALVDLQQENTKLEQDISAAEERIVYVGSAEIIV
jgi:peptidoglycan hydrolase CwlO-like protein